MFVNNQAPAAYYYTGPSPANTSPACMSQFPMHRDEHGIIAAGIVFGMVVLMVLR
jgi:hypothetical protein